MVTKTWSMIVIRACPRTMMKLQLQLTEHVGPAIDGELASRLDKIMREKADEDKIMELKKQHETAPPCRRKRLIKVSGAI